MLFRSKELCEKLGVPFSNKSVIGIARDLLFQSNKFRDVSYNNKQQVIQNAKGFCAICESLTEKGDVDHVVSLWAGGSNDIENLQFLCRIVRSAGRATM